MDMRSGIIGTGFIGGVHAYAVRAAGGVLAHVAAESPEHAAAAARRLGAEHACASAEELIQDTPIPNLYALTSGPVPPNPSELLASPAMDALMKSLEELGPFDHVFFDSPPLLQMADAVLLADRMEATIIVAREGRTVNAALASGVRRLRQSRARILGAVLNAVVEKFGGYYYYRYKYEPGDSTPQKLTRRLKLIPGSRRARRQA